MDNRLKFKGKMTNSSSIIHTELPLISFVEDDVHFVYCPALDLTGYGENEIEARNSFTQTLKIYFDYTTNKKTLTKDLERHGWKVRSNNKKLKAPDFDFLFKKNKQFKEIVNNRNFSKYNEQIQIPECVYA